MKTDVVNPGRTGQQRAIRARKKTLAMLLDVAVCVLALAIASAIRFSFEQRVSPRFWSQLWVLVPALALTRVAVNYAFGVYRMVWRYVGLRETVKFAQSVAAVSAVLMVLRFAGLLSSGYALLPLGVIVLEGVFTFIGMTALRFMPRLLREHGWRPASEGTPTLIVGAGRGGLAVVRDALRRADLHLRPVGYVDDDKAKSGMTIHGLSVLGTLDDVARVIKKTGAAKVIISTEAIGTRRVQRVLEACHGLGVPVHTVPRTAELLGSDKRPPLRELQIEDLLSRDPIPLSLSVEDLRQIYRGKRILVTGAGGSIGGELCRQLLLMDPRKLLLVERDETNLFDIHRELTSDRIDDAVVPLLVDITHGRDLQSVFRTYEPQVVFHAAAFKHVALMEQFPHEAIRNNVLATARIAELAAECGVETFVNISTDKAVNPTSVMGASKALAERVIQRQADSSETRFSCVRFGNVLGSRGSVVGIFREQIERGGPVTVTHPDATRYFMTIPEAANLVIQAATLGRDGEVFLLDMGEPVNILWLAKQMILLSGANPDAIDIRVIGTRPGEKLVEELRTDNEEIEKTELRKVYRCCPAKIDGDELSAALERLRFLIRSKDGDAIRQCLREIGIGYTPRRSPMVHPYRRPSSSIEMPEAP